MPLLRLPPLGILIRLALLALPAVVLGLVWHWGAERQVRLHFAALCTAVSERDSGDMEALIDPAYADRWGMDRTTVLRESREVLRQFFALDVQAVDPAFERVGPREYRVSSRLRISGTGTALAELAKQEANRIETPWVFTWKRPDWKPWHWQLTQLDNAGIDLSRHRGEW